MLLFYHGNGDSFFKNDTPGINQKFADSIYAKYGVNVYYGNNYIKQTEEIDATPLVDLENVNRNLKKIETLLKKYPKDFFKNLKISDNKKYTVSFYLVEKFSNDNIALAVKDNTNEYKLYISDYDQFDKALHHEIYHLIEYYMEEISGKGTLFFDWNKLNPVDFEYVYNVDKITTRYVYNDALKTRRAFFITNYSKYSSKEDRAEIFADMMVQNMRPIYYNTGEPIRNKAQRIVDEIQKVLKDFNLRGAYWYKYMN